MADILLTIGKSLMKNIIELISTHDFIYTGTDVYASHI